MSKEWVVRGSGRHPHMGLYFPTEVVHAPYYKNQEFMKYFAEMIPVKEVRDAEERWNSIHDTIFKAAVATYGKRMEEHRLV